MLKGVDFVATDVPGPPTDVFFAGAQVEALYAFAPNRGSSPQRRPRDHWPVGSTSGSTSMPEPFPTHDIMVTCAHRWLRPRCSTRPGHRRRQIE